MIQIDRGPEPPGLALGRRKELAKATLHWASASDASFERYDFTGYRAGAEELYNRQGRKCAYCERVAGWENQPVEHFRPKNGAHRGDPRQGRPTSTDRHHYWWLAWSWETQLWACSRCNGAATKGNWFPLLPGTSALPLPPREQLAALPAACFDIAQEHPWILDPSREDPTLSIVWLPLDENLPWEKLTWRPQGCDPDERGDVTIALFKLDGPHATDVTNHLRKNLTPLCRQLADAYNTPDIVKMHGIFDEIEKKFAETQPWLAATHDACEWFFRRPELSGIESHLQRRLPSPGRRGFAPCPPHAITDDPVEFQGLPDSLVLQLRAGCLNVYEGVAALCAVREFDVKTLATALACQEATVRQRLNQLLTEGKVVQTSSGGYVAASSAAPSSAPTT